MTEEEVAIRAGILLTDHEVFGLIDGSPIDEWSQPLRLSPKAMIGIRPEFFEDLARVLRAAVGNLHDAKAPEVRRIELLAEMGDAASDIPAALSALSAEALKLDPPVIGADAVKAVVDSGAFSENVVMTALELIADNQDRSALVLRSSFQSSAWTEPRLLSELFKTESIPSDPDAYLDQRFIDYLAAQTSDLPRLHWRNFERLTGEYFARLGYEVTLGTGSRDGGVDLRVWPSDSHKIGPPLLLVQCKRYSEGRLVEVEHVKALWTDVAFEGAEKGLVATTAAVSPDGKRTAAVRGYPLEFAEAKAVRNWVHTMWRHAWKGTPQPVELTYLLPPIYVAGTESHLDGRPSGATDAQGR